MLSIGEFARLGRVSVRMLRHYDALGLLAPARVDDTTAYRWYAAEQLQRLNRLVALKDLGFTLEQVRGVLDAQVGPDELRGMLRLRRAELADQIAADTSRLAQVEQRLRSIESEEFMSALEYVVKALPAQQVVQLHAEVDEQSQVGGVIDPMFQRLMSELPAQGLVSRGAPVATYDGTPDGRLRITAGFPTSADSAPGDYAVVQLPAVERAVTTVYRGSMEGISDAWMNLVRWAEENGLQTAPGLSREVYLETPPADPDAWVTELQQPVR